MSFRLYAFVHGLHASLRHQQTFSARSLGVRSASTLYPIRISNAENRFLDRTLESSWLQRFRSFKRMRFHAPSLESRRMIPLTITRRYGILISPCRNQAKSVVTMRKTAYAKSLSSKPFKDPQAKLKVGRFVDALALPPVRWDASVTGNKKHPQHTVILWVPLPKKFQDAIGFRELRTLGRSRSKKLAQLQAAYEAVVTLETVTGEDLLAFSEKAAAALKEKKVVEKKDVVLGGRTAFGQLINYNIAELVRICNNNALVELGIRLSHLLSISVPTVKYHQNMRKDGMQQGCVLQYQVISKDGKKVQKIAAAAYGTPMEHDKDYVTGYAFVNSLKYLKAAIGRSSFAHYARMVKKYSNLGRASLYPKLSKGQRNQLENMYMRSLFEGLDTERSERKSAAERVDSFYEELISDYYLTDAKPIKVPIDAPTLDDDEQSDPFSWKALKDGAELKRALAVSESLRKTYLRKPPTYASLPIDSLREDLVKLLNVESRMDPDLALDITNFGKDKEQVIDIDLVKRVVTSESVQKTHVGETSDVDSSFASALSTQAPVILNTDFAMTALTDSSASVATGNLSELGSESTAFRSSANPQVIILQGGTGSGKTTRVPQFILDEYIKKGIGHECKILISEPRRIAATSAAFRVSFERNERIGDSVGYHIRLERKRPRKYGSLEFVTTGVLLRRLQANPFCENVSHVIVDEVHERDSNSDMLLIALREALKVNPRLKVILMSATLDAAKFAQYFGAFKTALIEVPSAPRFKIKNYYLEDLESFLPGERSVTVRRLLEMEKTVRLTSEERDDQINSKEWNIDETNYTKQQEETYDDLLCLLSGELIANLVNTKRVPPVDEKSGGTILCFLPGWEELQAVRRHLSSMVSNSKIIVLMLHSSIPSSQQKLVFDRVPADTVKVVLSTNIAETSITIDDVTVVIDTTRGREMTYHPSARLSSLDCVHVNKSSLTQRRGRAGRVRPGECFRLVSRDLFTRLPESGIPEIQRCSLESLCLLAKAIFENQNIESVLAKALDPPSPDRVADAIVELEAMRAIVPIPKRESIAGLKGSSKDTQLLAAGSSAPSSSVMDASQLRPSWAVIPKEKPIEQASFLDLQNLKCFDSVSEGNNLFRTDGDGAEWSSVDSQQLLQDEQKEERNELEEERSRPPEILTALGKHLAALPLDPLLGRMVLLSVMLRGVEMGISIAAVLSVPNIFVSPFVQRSLERSVKAGVGDGSQQGGRRASASRDFEYSKTSDVLATVRAFLEWENVERQSGWENSRIYARDRGLSISSLILARGVKEQLRISLKSRRFLPPNYDAKSEEFNENISELGLNVALICFAVPNLAHRVNDHVLVTRSAQNAIIHPGSVNAKGDGALAAWYTYTEMTQTSNVFLRNSTAVSPIDIMLFGGSTISLEWPGAVVLDHWIVSKGNTQDIDMLKKTRREIMGILELVAQNPAKQLSETQRDYLNEIIKLVEEVRQPTEIL